MTPLCAIRRLLAADASAYRELRLRALREHPEAFTSSADEEALRPLAWSAERLRPARERPHDAFFGAWQGTTLIGMAGLQGRYRARERHNATVVGMVVTPECAGRGVGAALLQAVLRHAATLPELVQLDLTVTVGNEAALRLYQRQGFVQVGRLPRAIRVDNAWLDKAWMALALR